MLQKMNAGDVALYNGVLISYKDYDILKKRKEYLELQKELEYKLSLGLDV